MPFDLAGTPDEGRAAADAVVRASAPAVGPTPAAEPLEAIERRLDPRSVTADRIAAGVWSLVLAGVLLLPTLTLALAGPLPTGIRLLLPLAWLAACGLLAALALWWPALRYRHVTYVVDGSGLTIRRGVLWRTTITVPRSRVQHTDVAQGPIERAYGIATLVVYTAGAHHAAIPLSGLEHGIAVRIRDHLIAGEADDAV